MAFEKGHLAKLFGLHCVFVICYIPLYFFMGGSFFFIEWDDFSLLFAADSRRGPPQTPAGGLQQEVQELQQAAQHWRLLQEPEQRQRRAPREQRDGAQRGGNRALCWASQRPNLTGAAIY